ncbi:unnamed protein product [Parajaminaea phylloscopi]
MEEDVHQQQDPGRPKQIFRRNQAPILIHLPMTIGRRAELRSLIRRHGGDTTERVAKAHINIIDTEKAEAAASARESFRAAAILPTPVTSVGPNWITDSVKMGVWQNTRNPAYDPIAQIDDAARREKKRTEQHTAHVRRQAHMNAKEATVDPTLDLPHQRLRGAPRGKVFYTVQDAHNILEHIMHTKQTLGGLKLGEELAAKYPSHSAHSYQSWLRDNLEKGYCLRAKMQQYRETNVNPIKIPARLKVDHERYIGEDLDPAQRRPTPASRPSPPPQGHRRADDGATEEDIDDHTDDEDPIITSSARSRRDEPQPSRASPRPQPTLRGYQPHGIIDAFNEDYEERRQAHQRRSQRGQIEAREESRPVDGWPEEDTVAVSQPISLVSRESEPRDGPAEAEVHEDSDIRDISQDGGSARPAAPHFTKQHRGAIVHVFVTALNSHGDVDRETLTQHGRYDLLAFLRDDWYEGRLDDSLDGFLQAYGSFSLEQVKDHVTRNLPHYLPAALTFWLFLQGTQHAAAIDQLLAAASREPSASPEALLVPLEDAPSGMQSGDRARAGTPDLPPSPMANASIPVIPSNAVAASSLPEDELGLEMEVGAESVVSGRPRSPADREHSAPLEHTTPLEQVVSGHLGPPAAVVAEHGQDVAEISETPFAEAEKLELDSSIHQETSEPSAAEPERDVSVHVEVSTTDAQKRQEVGSGGSGPLRAATADYSPVANHHGDIPAMYQEMGLDNTDDVGEVSVVSEHAESGHAGSSPPSPMRTESGERRRQSSEAARRASPEQRAISAEASAAGGVAIELASGSQSDMISPIEVSGRPTQLRHARSPSVEVNLTKLRKDVHQRKFGRKFPFGASLEKSRELAAEKQADHRGSAPAQQSRGQQAAISSPETRAQSSPRLVRPVAADATRSPRPQLATTTPSRETSRVRRPVGPPTVAAGPSATDVRHSVATERNISRESSERVPRPRDTSLAGRSASASIRPVLQGDLGTAEVATTEVPVMAAGAANRQGALHDEDEVRTPASRVERNTSDRPAEPDEYEPAHSSNLRIGRRPPMDGIARAEGRRIASARTAPIGNSLGLARDPTRRIVTESRGALPPRSGLHSANHPQAEHSTLEAEITKAHYRLALLELCHRFGFTSLPQLRPFVDPRGDLKRTTARLQRHFDGLASEYGCPREDIVALVRQYDGKLFKVQQMLDGTENLATPTPRKSSDHTGGADRSGGPHMVSKARWEEPPGRSGIERDERPPRRPRSPEPDAELDSSHRPRPIFPGPEKGSRHDPVRDQQEDDAESEVSVRRAHSAKAMLPLQRSSSRLHLHTTSYRDGFRDDAQDGATDHAQEERAGAERLVTAAASRSHHLHEDGHDRFDERGGEQIWANVFDGRSWPTSASSRRSRMAPHIYQSAGERRLPVQVRQRREISFAQTPPPARRFLVPRPRVDGRYGGAQRVADDPADVYLDQGELYEVGDGESMSIADTDSLQMSPVQLAHTTSRQVLRQPRIRSPEVEDRHQGQRLHKRARHYL